MAACLPEQFWARERARAARGDPDVPLLGVVGQVGGVLEVGLGEARGREHLAHGVEVEGLGRVAGGREGELVRGRVSPARSIATDWSGLFDERGKTGSSGEPHAWSRLPSDAVTATVARCADSTNPPRTTWARTGASARAWGVGWSGTQATLSAGDA